jgi:hypothetical protein
LSNEAEDQVVDLREFARRLSVVDRNVAGRISGLCDAHSAWVDLVHAQDILSSLQIISGFELGDRHAENSAMACLIAAVVLYARATASSSPDRHTFKIEPHLNEDEKATHRMIVELRNDALAHFGSGERQLGASIRDDGVFFALSGLNGAGQIMTLSRSSVAHRDLAETLVRQVNRAVILSHRNAQERNDDVSKLLDGYLDTDEKRAAWKASASKLSDFIPDKPSVSRILGGPRSGSERGSFGSAN